MCERFKHLILDWLQWKYMRVIQSKFTKTKPKIFSNGEGGGAHARRAGPGSAFACKPTEQLTDLDVHVVIAKAFILIKLK